MKLAADGKPLAVEGRAVGDEPHVRMLFDIEEVGGAQMLVAPLVRGVEAVGLDGELDRRLGGEIEDAVLLYRTSGSSAVPVSATRESVLAADYSAAMAVFRLLRRAAAHRAARRES